MIYSEIMELTGCLLRKLPAMIKEQHALVLAYRISYKLRGHHGFSGASRRYEQDATGAVGNGAVYSRDYVRLKVI